MKRLRMRLDRTTAVIVIAAVLLGAAYMAMATWLNGHFADTVPSTSSLSTSSVGLKVWRLYLDRLGMQPALLTDFSSLPESSTIVFAGSFENPPSESDARRVEEWVAAGGHAVFVGLDDQGLGGSFDPPPGSVRGEASAALTPVFPGAFAGPIGTIAPGEGRFESRSLDWVSLFEDAHGAALMARIYGKGTVTWLADVTPVSNDGIGMRDDARLAVQLASAGHGRIYFDEYHHGLTDAPTVWSSIGAGGRAGIFLLLAGVAALLLARGRRLGPTIPVVETPAARGSAYIGQLAELFRKAGARSEALVRIEDGLIHALVRRYGDRGSGLARQPRAARALGMASAARARGSVTKDEFVAVARELRAARKEVEGGNG
jgi:hypothetical protein